MPTNTRHFARAACATVTVLAAAILPAQAGAQEINPDDTRTIENTQELTSTTDRFIITYTDETDREGRVQAMNSVAETSDTADEVEEIRERQDGTVVVEVDEQLDDAAAEEFMEEVRATGIVEHIEPDARMVPFLVNDEHYRHQWPMHGRYGGQAEQGWVESRYDGHGVNVAVIDTGITNHPDLQPNIIRGYDFISDPWASRDGNGRDSNPYDEGDWYAAYECGTNPRPANSSWHGTHVAGTIASATDNRTGVASVSPNAKIQPLRALGKCGGYTSDIADAIIWASGGYVGGVLGNQTPADIINLSLGGQGVCSRAYQSAIDEARTRGSMVVVAAGNESQNTRNVQPANCGNVITVGASAENGTYASYSNFGWEVDITAPGGDFTKDSGVLSTLNSGTTRPGSPTYGFYQGTSMATPYVAGVLASMLSDNPDLTQDEALEIITSTARPLQGWNTSGTGAGIIDAGAAIRTANS